MLPAFLTTLCYSASAVAGSRLSRILGGIEANFLRILFATGLLGLYAHTFGGGLEGESLMLFLLSGFLGFGICDLALYQAFPLIGSRLCMILVHCLAAPVAATLEWGWLGTILSPLQIGCSLVVLVGVAVALAPSEHLHIERSKLVRGVMYGVVAAVGQAAAAVVSRKAYDVAGAVGETVDGITAAYQRIWGGVFVAIVAFILFRLARGKPERSIAERMHGNWRWLFMNGILGPALGVSFFQWALSTTPTGIVLPIVALTPLTIIPFSRRFEGENPSRRSIIGGTIAVVGVIGLRFSLE